MNRPAQINENHPKATKGTNTLAVEARWCVNTRSKRGAVMIAANIPVNNKQAPMKPASSDEYPWGC